ncbi:hypothetical protein B0O80DRAFT_501717 [Mortierella sp. GBAus27b]|nr:tRNA methyltransferase 44 [Mortierella sp. GBA43]KAI8349026.1 hypothetical protein B0O80DRAFT_501717 [Mortierella sp. GBAus27b]
MKGGEPAAIEFVYDAVFHFDDLPNHKQGPTQEQPQDTDANQEPLTPRWYPVAKAPVPFSEDVFWGVLERWILEAPSIIPPVAKVEILQDHQRGSDGSAANDAKETSGGNSSVLDGVLQDGTLQLLADSRTHPFRTVRRQLIPKRADKDPVMNEWIYYIRSASTSHAVFGPEISSSTNSCDDIQSVMNTLPFYYPKVRGFRYGYMTDPEEAPEDRDDDHAHEDQDQDYEYEQESATAAKGTKGPARKGSGTARKTSRRLGWITLDLFMAGDESVFTDKMQSSFKELFKKLFKWCVNATKGFTKSRVQHDVMVPKDLYMKTYARLKERHAQKWVQSWPERTDPRKFVFEDIAIASWLVALWSLDRVEDSEDSNESSEQGQEQADNIKEMRKQTFVDLGCGNGLLTHILNEEGHGGTGIDIVSRKVWSLYGTGTQLEAKTIIPNETVFDNVDWIIGNHADELAPWIPVIAMRSKPLTKFVVIPCCFFDLSGSRYQFPKGAPDGKYKAYQEYICSVIETCGYELEKEILRIPSTKNVALVGMIKKRKREQISNSITHKDQQHQQSNAKASDGIEDYEDCYQQVDDLVRQSGLFVARISDKEKQELHKSRQTTKLMAREQAEVEAQEPEYELKQEHQCEVDEQSRKRR